jgi:hypothetical protein
MTPTQCGPPRNRADTPRECAPALRFGRLTHLTTNAIGPNVAFIVRCPTNPKLLYAVTERIDEVGGCVHKSNSV